jgi:hypothetical protein
MTAHTSCHCIQWAVIRVVAACLSFLAMMFSRRCYRARMQVLLLPTGTQLQRLTRLDLLKVRLKSGEQAALQQICQLTALQSLQLGYSNMLSSFSRYRCAAVKMLSCWCFMCLGCNELMQTASFRLFWQCLTTCWFC